MNHWGFWFESLILGLLVADGYKVLGLCTDVNVDAVVLFMVRGQWSVDGGSGFVDFTDGQSSVIDCRWVSFKFFFFFFTEQSVLHFFFFFNLLIIRIKESQKRKRGITSQGMFVKFTHKSIIDKIQTHHHRCF